MEVDMPVDSIMVATAVVAMFATVGFVLACGDRQTRNL
jgi:multisubunit Na+/H+ antiporter MnhC subunit